MKRHDEFQIQPTARLAFFRAASLWPLLWLAVLLCPVCAQAQELPFRANIDCSDLEVEFVLSNRRNLGTSCSSTTACGGGNNFSTVFYNVRLKHTTSDPMAVLDFDLKYDIVSANDDQLVTGAAPLDFPINKNVTEQCSAKGPAGAFDFMGCAGKFLFGGCTACNRFEVTPYKNNDPLNGVSTYDLVLINKHILGLEALSSPYKIIAADANYTHSITTNDIVQLRKLILGIFTSFSEIDIEQTSWRFIDKSFTFSNPSNPFLDFPWPEDITVDFSSSPLPETDFTAVKIGDVNQNAITHSFGSRPLLNISWAGANAKPGEYITVPVKYNGAEELEAIQLGLKFDPNLLSLVSPSVGDVLGYSDANFGLRNVDKGEIRTLWFLDPQDPFQTPLQTGNTLFYLTFKVKGELPESGLPISIEENILPSMAWNAKGKEFDIKANSEQERNDSSPTISSPDGIEVTCFPNPTSGTVNFSLTAKHAENVRLALFGPFAGRVWVQDIELQAGTRQVTVPELADLPAGVYIWKLYAKDSKLQGHLIKQ